MRFINKYNTTLDFENDKSRRKELDYSVSLDSESNKVNIESKHRIILKYTTTSENQSINLFFNQNKMDSLIQKCKIVETGEDISNYQYTFKNIGEHEVEIDWKPDVTNFYNCFQGCTGLTGTTPKDSDGGELWERVGKEGYPAIIKGNYCFEDCLKLENYDSIPSGWK